MRSMTKDQQAEAIQLLNAARNEIMNLRDRIASLEPKARAFDTLERYAQLSQPQQGGYAQVDNSWQIQRFINELESATRPAGQVVD